MDIASKILKKAEQVKQQKNTKEIVKESYENLIDTLRGQLEKKDKELIECKDEIISLQKEVIVLQRKVLNVGISKRNTTRDENKTKKTTKSSEVHND